MENNEFVSRVKCSHHDYYKGVKGPIGGDERFLWVMDTFSRDWKGLKILEVGCGEGSLLELLLANNECYGADISKSGVEKTREKGITCHHLDASNETLPFKDDFFDVIITLETIEHVENPHRMMWEIKRLLKPGGKLLISVPGQGVDHPFIYPGLFNIKNFKEFLTVNCFDIELVKGWGQSPMLARTVNRMRKKEILFWKILADITFFIGRKRNLILRKKIKRTPLKMAHTVNFLCSNKRSSTSIVEEVARRTTP